MKNKSVVLISIAVLIALFIGGISFYNNSQDTQRQSLSQGEAPFVRDHSIAFGDNKKNITVVEFLDPECEACAYFSGAVNAMFKENYEDIRLVIRYLDNHKNSKFAIKILESARKQNMYKEVLDVVFSSQGVWAKHNNEAPELLWKELAIVDGLDIQKLKKDFENIDIDEMLSLDRKDATTLQVRGTPTFFVNGIKLKRLSQQSLMDLVESEIYK